MMMEHFNLSIFSVFFTLIFAHLTFDYALQGDFMSKAKNHKAPIPGVPWLTILLSHSYIHGFAVYAITGSWILGLVELISHALIDHSKSEGLITFNEDQLYHLALKAFYVLLLADPSIRAFIS